MFEEYSITLVWKYFWKRLNEKPENKYNELKY